MEKGIIFLPGSCSALCIKIDGWYTKTDKSCEQGLLHIRELLESHVFNDRGQLQEEELKK